MLKRDGFKLFICAMVAAFFLALPFVVTSLNGAEKTNRSIKAQSPSICKESTVYQ